MPDPDAKVHTGTIKSASLERGKIERDGDGKKLEFSADDWLPGPGMRFSAGLRVEFEDHPRKGWVGRVRPIGWSPAARPKPGEAAGPPASAPRNRPVALRPGEGFLNPYNFARWLPEPGAPGAARTPLLGRAPGPPHDRYVGLTGRLRCVLTTETDTFVSDSYGVTAQVKDGEEHRIYRFFRNPDGAPAIPGSSLRGAVRTVFEAATNSCFIKVHGEARHAFRNADRKKVPYGRTVGEMIPEHLHACRAVDALCPACRTFGWVAAEAGERSASAPAYRGRVRFSDAAFTDGSVLVQPGESWVLPALSTPKPAYVWFYLMRESGRVEDGLEAEDGGYAPGNTIRGRKLYWHHEPREKGARTSDQNRSIRDWMGPGATAEFEVVFQNLAPVELGALLWSLEMEGEEVHRLGYGKPLGFGSVRIAVEQAEIAGPERYSGSGAPGGWVPLPRAGLDGLKDRFRREMALRYAGVEDPGAFLELRNVRDLRKVLASEEMGAVIAYPRQSPRDKGFEWFEKNRKGPRLALPPADSEEPGLPLRLPDKSRR